MADFCKQCNHDLFGEPHSDFAHIGLGRTLAPEHGYPVICEGCGFILVGNEGECISDDCLEKHGLRTKPT